MKRQQFNRRRWLIASAITVLMVLLGYLVLRSIERSFFTRETLRETTATVTGKEHVAFQEANPYYTDEHGKQIPVHPGDEQWRVYYQINHFDSLDESARAISLRAEKDLATAGQPRFEFKSKEWYDRVEIGDKLKVLYQWRGGDSIDVAYVENPKFPNLQ